MLLKGLHPAIVGAVAALLGVALYTDLRSGKIYNTLTLPCMLLGLAANTVLGGLSGLLTSLAGMGAVLLLALLFLNLSGIGGGDVKLMMAVGALLGLNFAIRVMVLSALAGGVFSLLVMLRHRILLTTLRGMLIGLLAGRSGAVGGAPGSIRFPYSPAIALGTLAAMVMRF
ncbi:MAG: A24 family peptidase [Armatimonadota bacterium]